MCELFVERRKYWGKWSSAVNGGVLLFFDDKWDGYECLVVFDTQDPHEKNFLSKRDRTVETPGLHTTTREPKRAHLRAPALRKHPQNSTRRPPREKRKKENWDGRRNKKKKFWAVWRRAVKGRTKKKEEKRRKKRKKRGKKGNTRNRTNGKIKVNFKHN